MKKSNVFLLALLLAGSSTFAQINFVAIGNSISHGKYTTGNYTATSIGDSLKEMSYRFWLWEKLDSAGINAAMVGYQTTYFDQGSATVASKSRYTGHPFANKSEAYYGIKSDGFINGGWSGSPDFDTRLLGYMPNVALIHIGSNDASATTADVDATEANLKAIIQKLRNRNPDVTILLAKLSSFYSPINTRVDKIVSETSKVNSIVYAVDIAADFFKDDQGKKEFLVDGIHPNVKGQKAMAKRWYDAYMKISKTEIIKPSVPQDLSATAMTDNSIDLIWSASTDNSGVNVYNVYMNDALVATTGNLTCKVTGINTTSNITYFKVTAVDYQKNESDKSESLKAPSSVTFNIKAGSVPLANATITFGTVSQITDASGNTTFSNFRPGTFNYTIKATDYKNLAGRLSITKDTTMSLTLSAAFMAMNEEGISIYPNPASSQVTISNVQGASLEIIDITGCVMMSTTIHSSLEIVNVSKLEEGEYLIKIKKESNLISRKILIKK